MGRMFMADVSGQILVLLRILGLAYGSWIETGMLGLIFRVGKLGSADSNSYDTKSCSLKMEQYWPNTRKAEQFRRCAWHSPAQFGWEMEQECIAHYLWDDTFRKTGKMIDAATGVQHRFKCRGTDHQASSGCFALKSFYHSSITGEIMRWMKNYIAPSWLLAQFTCIGQKKVKLELRKRE
jgi:hypothetical protein